LIGLPPDLPPGFVREQIFRQRAKKRWLVGCGIIQPPPQELRRCGRQLIQGLFPQNRRSGQGKDFPNLGRVGVGI
jgi:hypothetical protein